MTQDMRRGEAGAGLVGAIFGAGVALAASKILTDKNLRQQVLHTATELKNKMKKDAKEVADQAKDLKK